MGEPSAIMPLFIGDEGVGRISCRIAADHGAITNMVEFPGVVRGRARFRLQVQANHTFAQVGKVASILNDAIHSSGKIPDAGAGRRGKSQSVGH